jgi:hypothetical protein
LGAIRKTKTYLNPPAADERSIVRRRRITDLLEISSSASMCGGLRFFVGWFSVQALFPQAGKFFKPGCQSSLLMIFFEKK